jgi:dihydrolipoamide dehydrogenase
MKKYINILVINMNKETFDAVVIGGGPGGYTAAVRISQLGGKVCLIEKNKLGGVCANSGCIPTKSLLATAKSLAEIRKVPGMKVDVHCDFQAVLEKSRLAAEGSSWGVNQLLNGNNVRVISGKATITSQNEINIETQSGVVQTLFAKNIIIATGSIPLKPLMFTIDQNIITSEEVLKLTEIPREILIVGGGYIGLEYATIFNSFGSKVNLIEIEARLLIKEEEDISKEIEKIMRKNGVNIWTQASVVTIANEEGLRVEINNGRQLYVDKVLIAMGRSPNINKRELQEVGILFDKKGISVNEKLQTNIPNIYAIGDVNGKEPLAHTAIHEGIVAAENIMGRTSMINYLNIPHCIFTNPEVASIGTRTEKCGKFPFLANGKAHCLEETGFVKIYLEKEERGNILVGASIIGPQASELIAVVSTLLGKNTKEIRKQIVAHPTLSEAIYEAVLNAEGESINVINRKTCIGGNDLG